MDAADDGAGQTIHLVAHGRCSPVFHVCGSGAGGWGGTGITHRWGEFTRNLGDIAARWMRHSRGPAGGRTGSRWWAVPAHSRRQSLAHMLGAVQAPQTGDRTRPRGANDPDELLCGPVWGREKGHARGPRRRAGSGIPIYMFSLCDRFCPICPDGLLPVITTRDPRRKNTLEE